MNRALIVGGTSGIGKGIALALAREGNTTVTIAGRNEERGREVLMQLAKESSLPHTFVKVDCFDLDSVKQLQNVPCNLLVLTQGMATMQGYTPTVNGIDQKLQLHYFSRIYLARLLAPKMIQQQQQEGITSETNPPRILTVLSAGVHSKYKNYEKDFELKETYSIANAANAAGYYMDAGFETLAKENPSIIICHASPGFVNTNWGAEFPTLLRGFVRLLQPLGKSLEDCGNTLTSAWLQLSPEQNTSSSNVKNYFLMDPNGKTIANGSKHTETEREFIWEKTLELLPEL